MIHVVLVNYNGTDDTVACLASLRTLRGGPLSVTVVENGSREAARDELRRWGVEQGFRPEHDALSGALAGADGPIAVTLVFSPENLGFAGGNNVGIRRALADPACSHAWILNNDTEVDPDALAALRRRMDEDPVIGMCGSTLVFHDDRATVQAVGGRFNRWKARAEELAPSTPIAALPARAAVERDVAYVVGASMLVSRRFLEEVGPMSEDYFLYYEEIDWAARARGRFRLAWAPDSIVYHKEGGSIGTSSRARPSDLSLYYMARSSLRFLARHRPLSLPGGAARLGVKALAYALKGDRRAAAVIGRAALHAATGARDPVGARG